MIQYQLRSLGTLSLIGLIALVAACGGNSGSDDPTFTGTWRGQAVNGADGSTVQIELTLTQIGADVTGTYACSSLGTAQCLAATGEVSGTLVSDQLTASIVFPDKSSCGTLDATLTGYEMHGVYSCVTSAVTTSGTWNATKV